MIRDEDLLRPEWSHHPFVQAFTSTRMGGISAPPFHSLNLGLYAGDDVETVLHNRSLLKTHLPGEPIWLKQIHGNVVSTPQTRIINSSGLIEADAAVTNIPHEVLAILTADCMPVLFSANHGEVIGAAHAGWRGLSNHVLENTIAAMLDLSSQLSPKDINVWMGPAIGPKRFEVGQDVVDAFYGHQASAPEGAFIGISNKPNKYWADLYLLARHRLSIAGVQDIEGGGFCTYDDGRFYSYRRDGLTGRFASMIWINPN